MKIPDHIAVGLLLLTVMSCGGSTDTNTVPRPRAFHRIETPAAEFDTISVGGVSLTVNSSANIVRKPADGPSEWVDIIYPTLGGATIYCSITDVTPTTEPDVVANRLERMALNSGGNRSELTELVSRTGFTGRMMVTGAGTVTPVQFVASDGSRVLSGTLMINAADGFRPDSIAPVVETVSRDVITLLTNL